MKIIMEGNYQTRNGNSVRILCIDRKYERYPVVALIGSEDGKNENMVSYTKKGEFISGDREGRENLIEVPVAPLVFTDFLLEQGVDLELLWKNLGSKNNKFKYRTQTRKQYLSMPAEDWLIESFLWENSIQKGVTWRELNYNWKELVANKPTNQEVIFGEFFRNKTNLKD